jgi:hypothetical protein
MMVEIAGAIFGALIFFRVRKAYKHLTGSSPVHPVFKWIWATSCQMKHTVFWLLIKNRSNTRNMLRRRNMQLESYACELCIHQSEEKLRHMFFKCLLPKTDVKQLEFMCLLG